MQEHQCVHGNAPVIEMWADIAGYEGRYQVSTLGRVKSLARFRQTKGGGKTWMPERIMALNIKKETARIKPYAEVRLRNGGPRTEKCKSFLVHRLVAGTFIKNLEKDEQVDHRNGHHNDNRVENLRVMHYVEHGREHPLIKSGQLFKMGTAALMAKTGIVNG